MNQSLHREKTAGMSFLTGGEGPPFVLLHGIPGSAQTWAKVGKLLMDQYRVIIPDLAGFGQSDVPQGDHYMEGQARHLRQLLSELGIRSLYLGGHDFGGPVAVTLMRLYPDLLVRGLVLSATNMFTDTHVPLPLKIAKVPLLNTLAFKAIAGNRIGLRMMYRAAAKQKTARSWEQFNQHLTPTCMDLTRRIFQRSLANLKSNYRAVQDMLPYISCPALVLWGTDDPFFSTSVGERTGAAISEATLRIYPHTGHFVPEEQPAAVARDITQFFQSTAVTIA